MELRHVRSFLALAEELHFGRAAEKLHLSQPSLSEHLRRLERHVGVVLVARTSHHVRLTPAGEVFRREAERLLAQAEHAVRAARDTRHLRVGFNYPAGQNVLAPVLAALDEQGVRTSLVPGTSRAQLAELRADRVDVALVFGGVAEPGLRQRPVLTLPVVGVCAPGHPLATGNPVRWPELAPYRCLLPSRDVSPALHDLIAAAGKRHGLDFPEVFEDGDAAVVLVASRPLVIFASAARAETLAGLATLAFVDPSPRVTVYATWRDGDPNPSVAMLLELIAR